MTQVDPELACSYPNSSSFYNFPVAELSIIESGLKFILYSLTLPKKLKSKNLYHKMCYSVNNS